MCILAPCPLSCWFVEEDHIDFYQKKVETIDTLDLKRRSIMSISHFYDSHCHLSPSITSQRAVEIAENFDSRTDFPISKLNLMSTNQWDINYVHKIAESAKGLVNPCYGIHPWYSHLFTFKRYDHSMMSEMQIKQDHYNEVFSSSKNELEREELIKVLPIPVNFHDQLILIEDYLISDENAMVGEIGIDKLFRVPMNGYLGNGPDKERLSSLQVKMEHQLKVYKLLLQLAMKHNRSVSVHCVKAHGILFEATRAAVATTSTANKKLGINFCLHSYSGSVDQAKLWVKTFGKRIFFSLSEIINLKSTRGDRSDQVTGKTVELLSVVPPESVLTETDLSVDRLSEEEHIECLRAIAQLVERACPALTGEALYANWTCFTMHD